MASNAIIQIRNKGTITLPINFRRKYHLNQGDVFTLIDLGDGSFILTPNITQVNLLGDRIAQAMTEGGVSIDEILDALDEERERYYKEHYVEN